MPRPPILPTIDWREVYEKGLPYLNWIAKAEHPEHRDAMEAAREAQDIPEEAMRFLQGLPKEVHVIAIAEDWCGDVVRHVPVLQALADHCAKLGVRYIAREDRPDVFVRFLTNGGEAIPKFIFLSDQFVECGNWGPMPEHCRYLISRGKACGDVGGARQLVAAAYNADPEKQQVVKELVHLIDTASSTTPDPAASLAPAL